MVADLQVTTTNASRWGRILTIEFPRSELDSERSKALRDLQKRMVRPGFRKGKVPRALVEKEFGDSLQRDALDKLIPQVCSQAIEQENLDIISTPKVKSLDLDHPDTVRLEVELDVRPEIHLAELESLRAERWKPEPADADVDKALEAVRDQRAEYLKVEREAQDGDIVSVSYVPLDDSGNEQSDQRVENYPFQLGEGQVVAEFESAVRGLAAGGTARVEVRYPENHDNPELAGRLVAMILTVNEVKEKRLPELDDELARDLDLENLEELRGRVREDLERRLAQESDRDLEERLVDALIVANPVEPPQSMVDAYLSAVMRDYEERHRQMQMEVDVEKRQEMETQARPAAERAVKRMLLLDELRKKYDLEATEEDVDKWIQERVEAGGDEGSKIRKYFADPERRRRLRGELTDARVFEHVKSKAVISEVPRPSAT
jgi:trigger factor